jgi:ankyrin repeat protein
MSGARVWVLALAVLAVNATFEATGGEETPGKAPDPLDAYRLEAKTIVESHDLAAAEKLLLKMPDVDLLRLVEQGDRVLVELVVLGDPDRLRRRFPTPPTPGLFAAATANRDLPMLQTLVRLGMKVPDDCPVLNEAVRIGDLDAVKAYIQCGANINASESNWGGSALHQALYYGHEAILDALLEAGADVNTSTDFGWTPLHVVAQTGRIDHAKRLIERGARPQVANQDGMTPVHEAIWHGKLEFARWLSATSGIMDAHIAAGFGDLAAAKKLYPDSKALDEKMARGPSPVFWAAMSNQLPVVEYFVASGVDVNLVDSRGRSLLICAARRGADAVVGFLVKQGAKLQLAPSENSYEWEVSPLHAAAAGGHLKTMRILLDHGIEVDFSEGIAGESPLCIAAKENQLDAIRLLVERGANLNGAAEGSNPLCEAISRHRFEACRLLLELGASPNGAEGNPNTNQGTYPLASAVSYRQPEIFELLLKHGADPRNLRGGLALSQCIDGGDPQLTLRLIELGADVNCHQRSGSILLRSLDSYHRPRVNVVFALLKAGVRAKPEEYDRLAIQAGRLGNVEVIKALIDQGLKLPEARQSKSSINGWRSALEGAATANRKDMVRFLLSRGMLIETPPDYDEDSLVIAKAASAGAKLAVLELLSAGAGKELRVPAGRGVRVIDPLSVAAKSAADAGMADTFRTLVRYGALQTTEAALTALKNAVYQGHVDVLKAYFETRKPASKDLSPLLLTAAGHAQMDVAKLLLERGTDPNAANSNDQTPLHEVADYEYLTDSQRSLRLKLATLLIESGARPDPLDSHGRMPAHLAIARDQLPLAQLLIERGSAVDVHLAAATGKLEKLERARDLYPEALTRKLEPLGPPLAWAAAGGSVEAIQWLVKIPEVEIDGDGEQSPLLWALRHRNLDAVRALLDAGANVDGNKRSWTSLVKGVESGSVEAVELLLKHDVDRHQSDANQTPALHLAVLKNRLDLVQLLASKGVPLDMTDRHGNTALDLAYRGVHAYNTIHRDIVTSLMKAGADPKAGHSEALYYELRWGDMAALNRLLAAGLDPNKLTGDGQLPLRAVIERCGVNMSSATSKHKQECLDIIAALIKHGADPEKPDKWKRTAIWYAHEYSFPEAIEAMQSKPAAP